MTHEEMQLLWDQAMVRAWRRFDSVLDAMIFWKATTQMSVFDVSPPLRRLPPVGMPWKIGMRSFVARKLPKISDRLWAQPPERDEALIAKLQGSTYDTLTSDHQSNSDRELYYERKRSHKNSEVLKLDSARRSDRNRDSDWSTTKATVARRQRIR